MQIQCDCGQFKAKINKFPKQTPGRLGCYCDDCQSFLIYIHRTDNLDSSGCTEVVPVYPSNLEFVSGVSQLKCLRLTERGTYRWVAACCDSPIANTRPGTPWVGLYASVFGHQDSQYLQKTLGSVKARIMGRFAKGETLPKTADKMNLTAFFSVLPFILKGKIFKKYQVSPFFKQQDQRTPIVEPVVLNPQERAKLRQQFELISKY